ncbi:MAG: ATP-binding cassette domain-containing protein [Bacteroidales bacterium]|nr:ATP-binding cassette domain-containing protein [Bacteroidales bacterium]
MDSIIKFHNADIRNGEETVIYDLNMEIKAGDFVYLVGKVGTGKTSIIRTITAENRPGDGSFTVCGYDLSTIRAKDIPYLRRSIGVVFQDFQLLMDRTVRDNLEFVLKATGWKGQTAIDERIDKVLKDVGMETKAHKMPHHLSGGEQQRIAIARAILNNPKVILADEPTGNLDGFTASEIMELLNSINREQGTAILMVTHNTSIFENYPGRVFICANEKCVEISNETF